MKRPGMEGKALTILLVEDNPDHAELVTRSLEEHMLDASICHVEDGAAALDYLYQRGKFQNRETYLRPHVILLDLRLPKIDGLDVLERIKKDKSLSKIPVVILTTSDAEKDVKSAYANHANSYLVKPIDFEKFWGLMKDLGYYWLNWNHHPRR